MSTIATFASRNWAPTVTFRARLAILCQHLQEHADRLPSYRFVPRVRASVKLSLDDLAVILPPTEQRLLGLMRARRPIKEAGFKNSHRRERVTRRMLSRVHCYCGAIAYHRLVKPYDYPGDRRRPGRRRVLLPPETFPPLEFWVTPQFASIPRRGIKILDPLLTGTQGDRRHAA